MVCCTKNMDVTALSQYAEGYLIKQGGRFKTWRKRFFQFHNGALSYRKDNRDKSKVLRREMIIDVHFYNKVKNGLCVTLASGRVLYLSAKLEEHANTWFDVFTEYLQQQEKHRQFLELHLKARQPLEAIDECESVMDDDFRKEDFALLSDTDTDSESWLFTF
ncbi:hypothetical protein ATCC90586_003275 [Pythium insidiosum]|nr:hypothetical protein ATCC90586_003275 [Pythium insidiosum]